MSKLRYDRKQPTSLVPRFAAESRSASEVKKAAAVDRWRKGRMVRSDYHSLSNKELRRLDRLEAIKKAVESPEVKYAQSYPESMVQVLPPAPNESQPGYVRQRSKKSHTGKMS